MKSLQMLDDVDISESEATAALRLAAGSRISHVSHSELSAHCMHSSMRLAILVLMEALKDRWSYFLFCIFKILTVDYLQNELWSSLRVTMVLRYSSYWSIQRVQDLFWHSSLFWNNYKGLLVMNRGKSYVPYFVTNSMLCQIHSLTKRIRV